MFVELETRLVNLNAVAEINHETQTITLVTGKTIGGFPQADWERLVNAAYSTANGPVAAR